MVVGTAGTGKTTFWTPPVRPGSYQVIGGALARRAALELRDGADIDSTSIHALLADLRERPGELFSERTILVVDEATCPAFGGAELATPFVTSTRHRLTRARVPQFVGI